MTFYVSIHIMMWIIMTIASMAEFDNDNYERAKVLLVSGLVGPILSVVLYAYILFKKF